MLEVAARVPAHFLLMAQSSRWFSFAVLLGVAWATVACILLFQRWPEMGQRLFDTDDAMRLVQVREFIAGHGWFDLHETRLGPPAGYDTHWARLVDAGLAGLYFAARPFADPDLAERLMRALWPLIWLLVAMAGVAALAWRIAGRNAALISLVVSSMAIPAFQHYQPGRIDHHNVQIALALAVIAAAAWSDRARHASALAGALTGLAAAVGLESVPLLALAGAAIALRFVGSDRAQGAPGPAAHPLAQYGGALAASMFVALLLNVAPSRWSEPACDAVAVNWLLGAAIAGFGLVLADYALPRAGLPARLAAVAAAGGLALAAFVVADPRCIHGPFALTDDAVKAVWLSHVDEMEPLVSFVRGYPLLGAWMCSFPLVAALALALLAREREARRDFGFLLAASAFVVAVAATFAVEKVYSYAMWFGMPLVAAMVCRLDPPSRLRAAIGRVTLAVVLAPTVVTAIAFMVIQALAAEGRAKPGISERVACTRNDAYRPLIGLPPGLVATEINYGPFVLALTPHAVVAAPYHRLPDGMLAADAILTASPDEARRMVERERVDYVAICGSLWAELQAGRPPAWLAPLADPEDAGGIAQRFVVYRVRGR
jgi:hypothetical protein